MKLKLKLRTLRHGLVLLIPILCAGCFKTRQDIAREKEDQEVRSNLQQNIVDYNQGLEKTQSELGQLQGRIEELEHQRKKEMSGLTSSHESELKTIEELKAKLTAMQESQNTLFEEMKKLKEDGLASQAAAAAAGAKKKVGTISYDSAIGAYKNKDYAAAVVSLRAYLEAHPRSKHTLDAHYYLAESLFMQKNYEQAVAEFGVVNEKSPSTKHGRRSTLRIAQSFKAMGKLKDSRAFAQLLIQSSPGSDEAKQARKLLK